MELASLNLLKGAPQGLPPVPGEEVVAASSEGAAGPQWKRPRLEGSTSTSTSSTSTSGSSGGDGGGGTAAALADWESRKASAAAASVAAAAAARELAYPTRPSHGGQPLPPPPLAAPAPAAAAAAVAGMGQGPQQKQKGVRGGSLGRYHLKSPAQTAAIREAFLVWGGTTTTQPPALVEAFCAQWGLTRLQVSSQFSNIRRSKKWLREQRLATSGSSPSRSSAIGGEGGAPDPTLLMPSSQQQQPGAQDGLPALWHPLKRWRNARGSNCAVCRKHKKRCDGTQLGCLKAAGGGAEAGPGPAAQRPEEGEEEGLQPPPPPPAAAQKARWTAYTTKTPAQTAALRDAFAAWGGTIKDQPPHALDAFCAQWALTKKEVLCFFSYLRKSKGSQPPQPQQPPPLPLPPPPQQPLPPQQQQAAAPPATAAPYMSSFGGGGGWGGVGPASAPWTGGTDYWYGGGSGRPAGGGGGSR